MFSYLRPHHKRTPSNPSSPAEQVHSFEPPQHPDHGHPPRNQDAFPEAPTRPPPPPGSPITRVLSAESNIDGSRRGYERDPRIQQLDSAKDDPRSRDTYTFNNHQRLPYVGPARPESAGNAAPASYTTSQNTRPGMNHETYKQKQSDSNQNYMTSTEAQSRPVQTGRRPNGARLPSPPPSYSTFEPVQQKSSRTRLNLLNPMSLLARRRTSQAVTYLSPESLVSRNHSSNSFDPRIRGTVVHDFSAPRPPRRNVSYNDVRVEDNSNGGGWKQFQRSPNGDAHDDNATSPWSGGNHTPVFTENFEEEQYPAAGPHVRKASDLTDLPLPKPPYAKGVQKSVDPKSNEVSQKQFQADPRRTSIQKPIPDVPPPVPPKSDGQLLEPRRISIDPASTPPKPKSVASKKGRSRNVSEVSVKDTIIPKHMKSTSSRFSFDMIGAAEQERLLEDRHRQKALERKAEAADEEDDRLEDDFENDYDYDNMMDDDGLEERIPGVNADYDEEEDMYDDLEEPIPGVNTELDDLEEEIPYENEDGGNLAGFSFQQSQLASPLSPASPGMVSTPRDANGEVIGFAMTRNSPYISQGVTQDSLSSSTSDVAKPPERVSSFQGLGLQGMETHLPNDEAQPISQEEFEAEEFPRPAGLEDDDLYFDDGIISGPVDDDEPMEFDESVFDNVDTDEYGRPLKSFSSLPTLYSPPMVTDPSPTLDKIVENPDVSNDTGDQVSPGTHQSGGLAPQPSVVDRNRIQYPMAPPSTMGLTQDTLEAYQSALAAAAFTAAANGKFRRDSINPTPSEQEDTQPGLIPDSSQTSHYEPFSPSYELEDDFDYDDALEDDPIIAAANAEALANDCDGFYGQEFGFYSAPAGEAEYANGGYFGPRGVEGINRTQSGRVASREPNLTPITERSEYSNRNSFMSLSMHGPSPGNLSSPGLAQLAGMLRSPTADYDGDMSLDALLKLRRGAWGGSQASLHSSNGGSPRSAGGAEDTSSPIQQIPPWNNGGAVGPPLSSAQGHRRKNSTFSIGSEGFSGVQSETSSAPGSPTLTMSVAALDEKGTADTIREKDNSKEKGMRKHRYTGSAESISYLKEEDPVEGERWILERRRTAESGEVEVLGREVVSGGRI